MSNQVDRAIRATQLFSLYDQDQDGVLNDLELRHLTAWQFQQPVGNITDDHLKDARQMAGDREAFLNSVLTGHLKDAPDSLFLECMENGIEYARTRFPPSAPTPN